METSPTASPLAHTPVLFKEVMSAFAPLFERSELTALDATFGRGGHSRGILASFPQAKLVGLDQDSAAIDYGIREFSQEISSGRMQLVHSNFAEFQFAREGNFAQLSPGYDMILVDLGVSSPQLDQPERGFSFYEDGPLDMRMNQDQSITASDVIHDLEEGQLIEMFKTLGEIRRPFRFVRALVHDRKTKRFESTRDLATMIERIDGWRIKGRHPATQYFLALRLYVNRELEVTQAAIPKMMQALKPGGRLVVISFHSLEDRIVKYLFRDSNLGKPVNKKVIEASEEEVKQNPRSRSAKLRIFEKDSEIKAE